ncbi:LOW QUALITY PROTEIN: hypothetical protein M514_23416 [Trichuris suis]|uniref:Integrase zinc-binding domain-containing protein n=1 Tax=Trichuris suis TaxID=68888 RepID=A0A085N4J6_9BILA|nr:LOW QUALITY PROTEIN: hypothetical protein M514_23416 [Trichuris suis]
MGFPLDCVQIFDPMGFISPTTLHAKCILRQTWLLQIYKFDPLPEKVKSAWDEWINELPLIESLIIPRSLITSFEPPNSVQMHLFSDASEAGILTQARKNGNITVSFVCSKARVAPLRYLTVPRLELQAALISSRLGSTLQNELRIKVTSTYYWTDSQTVLHWLNSSGKRYSSKSSCGGYGNYECDPVVCYVPTRENFADDCSRGLSPSKISLHERWFAGPAFLFEEESAWPKWPQLSVKQAEVEELHLKWAGYTSISQRPLNELIYKERNLKRMCRVVAYTIRFLNNCSSDLQKRRVGPLNVEEIDRALRACVSVAQHEGFEEEVACLLLNKPLKTQSNLLPLSPFIDNSGLMRVQGRIDKADIPYEARHPIILPPKHPLTKTIIEDMHRTLRHGSVDLILCELRQRYWLPKYRQRVKSVVYECVYCKKWRSKPSTPFMAQLPTERLQAFQPPFSCVGIDYFGPLTVLVRRSHEKRYGCLFTCMSTRAVHLEISSLITSFEPPNSVQMHLFSDASEAGILTQARKNGNITVSFVCSKARVAPLRYLTVPRLELQAALISSRLGSTLQNELRIKVTSTYYWTDSQTVLHWLNSSGKRYSSKSSCGGYGNYECDPVVCYVPTRENFADDCSRGLSPSKISLHERWFAGPAFLFEEESAWPKWPQLSVKQAEVEELHLKWAGYTSISQRPLNELIYKERNLKRMCRVVAYTIRFLNNCSSDLQKRRVGPLNVEEIDRALRACVSVAQHEGFEEEVACLLLNKPLKTQSNLLPLSPFIDNSGLMRVQGRIDKADIPYEARHPIILPPKHPLTKTIIEDMHRTLRHGSVDLILCELRQHYWLPK